jgi:hypothetical protein
MDVVTVTGLFPECVDSVGISKRKSGFSILVWLGAEAHLFGADSDFLANILFLMVSNVMFFFFFHLYNCIDRTIAKMMSMKHTKVSVTVTIWESR